MRVAESSQLQLDKQKEDWMSGLNQQFTKLSTGKTVRGFESHILRNEDSSEKSAENMEARPPKAGFSAFRIPPSPCKYRVRHAERGSKISKNKITMLEYICYQLHIHPQGYFYS